MPSLVLSLLLLLGGSSTDDYVGAETCRPCHQQIYNRWLSEPHAGALSRLAPSSQGDARCVGCHSTGPSQRLAGVQCEACHGPGRYYAADYIMRDLPLARALGLQPPTEAVCRRCHTADAPGLRPFDYVEMLPEIDHSGRGQP